MSKHWAGRQIRATNRRDAVLRGDNWAAVAQLVEHIIRNDGVGGSNPFSGTSYRYHTGNTRVTFSITLKTLVIVVFVSEMLTLGMTFITLVTAMHHRAATACNTPSMCVT
jgi:hypothetical protein